MCPTQLIFNANEAQDLAAISWEQSRLIPILTGLPGSMAWTDSCLATDHRAIISLLGS